LAAISPVAGLGVIPASALIGATATILLATVPTTRLRAFALVPALFAFLSFQTRTFPEILIAENGELAAMRMADASLAMSRARPNAFTTKNWQRATASTQVRKPINADTDAHRPPDEDELPIVRQESAFRCRGGICFAIHNSGARMATAERTALLEMACAWADLLVVDDATLRKPCGRRRPGQMILTTRDLARRGSASVAVSGPHDRPHLSLRHAVEKVWRPWHRHRQFSRAARGLAETPKPTHSPPKAPD
jgi:competence protein ComEC